MSTTIFTLLLFQRATEERESSQCQGRPDDSLRFEHGEQNPLLVPTAIRPQPMCLQTQDGVFPPQLYVADALSGRVYCFLSQPDQTHSQVLFPGERQVRRSD